jgi:cytoskeletal protein RodZ
MYYKNKKYSEPKYTKRAKLLLLVGVIVLLVGIAGVSYALFHDSNKAPEVTASSDTKGEVSNGSKTASGSTDTTTTLPEDNKSSTGGSSSTPTNLIIPSGVFVSNHFPQQGGTTALQSNCTTSPGATCQISFTKDGVVKSLPAQTTDKGGATYWNWDYKDLGLTTGAWHVEAKANYGSQTQTATDGLDVTIP